MIDDGSFFERNAGLDPARIPELNAFLQSEFSDEEIPRLSQFLEEERAVGIPGSKPTIRDLPNSYVELLKLSNGGGIAVGDREIAFFEKESLRCYLVDYQFPVYMPSALAFGLNGGGLFYIFDMREPATDGEYPIVISSSGNLGFNDSPVIAHSIQELLADSTNIEDLL